MTGVDTPHGWSPNLATGIEAIDNDHKTLLNMLEICRSASLGGGDDEVFGSAISTLLDYSEFHFAREEFLMRAIGFQESEEHQLGHREILQKVRQIRDAELARPGSSNFVEIGAELEDRLTGYVAIESQTFRPILGRLPVVTQILESFGFAEFLSQKLEDRLPVFLMSRAPGSG